MSDEEQLEPAFYLVGPEIKIDPDTLDDWNEHSEDHIHGLLIGRDESVPKASRFAVDVRQLLNRIDELIEQHGMEPENQAKALGQLWQELEDIQSNSTKGE